MSYNVRIKDLFFTYSAYIILTKPHTCVAHSNLNVFVTLQCLNTDLASGRCKLSGIVGQCVYHKKGENPVSTYHSISSDHFKLNTLLAKTAFTVIHYVKQVLNRKALHIEIDHALTYAYPLRKQVIILINTLGKFTHILQTLTILLTVCRHIGQMEYLRAHTVYIRQALGHNLATGLSRQILPLVIVGMNTIQVVLFFGLPKPIGLSSQFIGITQRGLYIRCNSIKDCPAVTVYPPGVP